MEPRRWVSLNLKIAFHFSLFIKNVFGGEICLSPNSAEDINHVLRNLIKTWICLLLERVTGCAWFCLFNTVVLCCSTKMKEYRWLTDKEHKAARWGTDGWSPCRVGWGGTHFYAVYSLSKIFICSRQPLSVKILEIHGKQRETEGWAEQPDDEEAAVLKPAGWLQGQPAAGTLEDRLQPSDVKHCSGFLLPFSTPTVSFWELVKWPKISATVRSLALHWSLLFWLSPTSKLLSCFVPL